MKRIHITTEDGRIYSVDANAVAHDIATSRAEGDPDTRYGMEFERVIKDDFELLDWIQNNMDWFDMSPVLEFTPVPVDPKDAEVVKMEVHEEKRK